jgi:hypothetical protein
MKWAEVALFDLGIIGLRFENPAWQEELFLQFLMPLLTKMRWGNDQNTAFAFGLFLGDDQTGRDGLP